jgi:tryptophanyl-tRNA synthetase
LSEFEIDPWKVEGRVNYNKIIAQFRVQKIDEALKGKTRGITGNLHPLLRRNIVFSHRDYDRILDDYVSGKSFFLYTGRAPSFGIHIGHLLPFQLTKWLQDKFNVHVYIEITDDEKFLSNETFSLDGIRQAAFDNILDIIALGFDPERTFIFQDTEYIRQIYPLCLKIAKKLTVSELRSAFGFENSTNPGLLFYPCVQMSVSMFEKNRCLIPAGIDQDPYWRLQRDIAESLGYYKTSCLYLKFLPPLTGFEGKMSSSKSETAVYLRDDPETVRERVLNYAFSGGQPTVELHRKLGGNPEIDVSFQWLSYLFEPDDNRLTKIEQDYRSGKLLSGELKEILIEKLNAFLQEHAEKKVKARELIDVFKSTGSLARPMEQTFHQD